MRNRVSASFFFANVQIHQKVETDKAGKQASYLHGARNMIETKCAWRNSVCTVSVGHALLSIREIKIAYFIIVNVDFNCGASML